MDKVEARKMVRGRNIKLREFGANFGHCFCAINFPVHLSVTFYYLLVFTFYLSILVTDRQKNTDSR